MRLQKLHLQLATGLLIAACAVKMVLNSTNKRNEFFDRHTCSLQQVGFLTAAGLAAFSSFTCLLLLLLLSLLSLLLLDNPVTMIAIVTVIMIIAVGNTVLNSLSEWWTDLQGCLLLEGEHSCLHQRISLAAICQVLQL